MNCEDRLTSVLDTFDESRVRALLEGIELSPDRRAAKRITKRIIGSGHIRTRVFKKTAAVAFAAAAAVLAAVTGVAIALSAHKEPIDERFGSGAGDRMESRALLDGSVFDSEHYRMTVDTVLCTGEQLAAVITLEPKDEETAEYIRNGQMLTLSDREYERFGEALASQGCTVGNGGFSSSIDESGSTPLISLRLNFDCACPKGKTCSVSFGIYDAGLASDYAYTSFAALSEEDQESRRIGEVTLNIIKNLDYKEFRSKDGIRLGLCDIGFRCGAYHELHAFEDTLSLTFEMKDGSRIEYLGTDIANFSVSGGAPGSGRTSANFTRWIDTEKVTSVIIGGTRYEEVSQ